MNPNKQSANIYLSPSWSLVSKNIELLRLRVEQVTIIFILPALAFGLGDILLSSHKIAGLFISFIGGIWWILSIGASYFLQVSATKGKLISSVDCYKNSWKYIVRIIIFTFIFTIMVIAGLILLIIPGLIIIRRYILTPYYIVDQNLPIRKAMDLSSDQTKPVSGYVWGTIGVVFTLEIIIVIVSMFFVAIPGATTIISTLLSPVFFFLFAIRYREITKLPKSAEVSV
jgi:hypothetical protein